MSLGRSRKEQLYCFARQKGPEWANTLKIVYLHLEGIERSFAVMALKGMIRDFLGHPVVKIALPFQGVQVQTLVGKLDPAWHSESKKQYMFFSFFPLFILLSLSLFLNAFIFFILDCFFNFFALIFVFKVLHQNSNCLDY